MNQTIAILTHTERAIPPSAVLALYRVVAWLWISRPPDVLATVLDHHPAVGAWDGERLIGFARAVTDGHFRAYIEDVIVHPDYQRQHIGQELMAHLLTSLTHIDVISLFCQSELRPFYEQLGFQARGQQMVLHKNHALH